MFFQYNTVRSSQHAFIVPQTHSGTRSHRTTPRLGAPRAAGLHRAVMQVPWTDGRLRERSCPRASASACGCGCAFMRGASDWGGETLVSRWTLEGGLRGRYLEGEREREIGGREHVFFYTAQNEAVDIPFHLCEEGEHHALKLTYSKTRLHPWTHFCHSFPHMRSYAALHYTLPLPCSPPPTPSPARPGIKQN